MSHPLLGKPCEWPDCDGTYVDGACATVVFGKPTPSDWVRCQKCGTSVSPRIYHESASEETLRECRAINERHRADEE